MSTAKKTAISPTRAEDYPGWYQQVVKHADLAELAVVRGCMVIKPWGYALWEKIQNKLDRMIKETGHKNFYCPLFVPVSLLEKEASHVEGFAKECAVVTHHRLEKQGNKLVPASPLEEPFIVRPTSEALIGELYSQWVKSYRDLPILLNQWANVVRWEMRTRIFLRTTEFLWQEGHTAHATAQEAQEETLKMLNVYERLAHELLAMPVISGEKTQSERFPGAQNTYTIEAMMQDGKALQSGTSHYFGQNFARAFNIKFIDQNGVENFAWTTSWGVTTRLIGGLVMTHSDDDGLVLPPSISPIHIVLLPLTRDISVLDYCVKLQRELQEYCYAGESIEVLIDDQDKRHGDKAWGWVKKGVPIRIEIGKQEVQNNTLCVRLRNVPYENKQNMARTAFTEQVVQILENMQQELFLQARALQEGRIVEVKSLAEVYEYFQSQKQPGFIKCYYAEDLALENKIKQDLKITPRCIPLSAERGKCIFTQKLGQMTLFGKSY